MNTTYERIHPSDGKISEKLNAVGSLEAMAIPADIPHGDMPGDKIEIGESHIAKANTIFPVLLEQVKEAVRKNPYERVVLSVCGGSGVGKSEIASILGYMFGQIGIGAYVMSGDNYPHRIPKYNDAERLHIFREGGIRAMVDAGDFTVERFHAVQSWQEADDDANAEHTVRNPWFGSYLTGGRKALAGYLGTPKETDFEEVDRILHAFKDGAKSLWLKRMGRDESALWYSEIDMSDVQVLILEWTHGNSDHMKEVDLPILLNSTPQETLEHRRSRNRDGKTDSAFTMTVLEIEQGLLHRQAAKARIIVSKSGDLMSFEEYSALMKDAMQEA